MLTPTLVVVQVSSLKSPPAFTLKGTVPGFICNQTLTRVLKSSGVFGSKQSPGELSHLQNQEGQEGKPEPDRVWTCQRRRSCRTLDDSKPFGLTEFQQISKEKDAISLKFSVTEKRNWHQRCSPLVVHVRSPCVCKHTRLSCLGLCKHTYTGEAASPNLDVSVTARPNTAVRCGPLFRNTFPSITDNCY